MISNRVQKKKDLSKISVLRVKQFGVFRQKRNTEKNSGPLKNVPLTTGTLNTTRVSENYCARHKIISLGPKRWLKTLNFEKKDYLYSEEKKLAYFFRILEYVKPQGAKY